MSIKPDAEKALRVAMGRLLAGEPKRTDGKLMWANVYAEAGVPRATAARATTVIADWKEAVRQRSQSEAPPLPAEETQALKQALEDRAREAAATHLALRETIRTMANHIQALSLTIEQRDALIAQLRSEDTKVVSIGSRASASAGKAPQ